MANISNSMSGFFDMLVMNTVYLGGDMIVPLFEDDALLSGTITAAPGILGLLGGTIFIKNISGGSSYVFII